MIILNAQGQTCNKFFTYQAYIADSLESGEKIIILSPDITIKYFPNLRKSSILKFPFYNESLSKIIGYNRYIKLLKLFFSNKYSLLVFSLLLKWVPGVKYINCPTNSHKSENSYKYDKEIKKIFAPHLKIEQEIDLLFKEERKNHEIICGVHIRQGDYKNWRGGRYYYTELQFHYIMLNIKTLFYPQSVCFFISSNSKINYSTFTDCNFFTVPHGNAVKDLYGLSISDYIIGPPSTFSGWASYFGDTPLYFIEDVRNNIEKSSFKKISSIWF